MLITPPEKVNPKSRAVSLDKKTRRRFVSFPIRPVSKPGSGAHMALAAVGSSEIQWLQ